MAGNGSPTLKVLAVKLPTISADMVPKAKLVVPTTLEEMRTLIRQRVPVWTGALMNSTSIVMSGPYRGDVGTNKVYGPIIHRDRPYIADVIDAIEPRFLARASALLPGGSPTLLPPLPSLPRYPSRMIARGIRPSGRRFR